jgi:multiple sugar transport system permease protein
VNVSASAPSRDSGGLDAGRRAFLTPAVAIVLVLSIVPLVASLALSFTFYNFANRQSPFTFAWLQQWQRLLGDEHFHTVARNTLAFVAIAVPAQYVLGLVLAVILAQDIRGRRFFRLLFLVPLMLSPVAVAYVLGRMLFNESQGPVNDLLVTLGVEPMSWLTGSPLALITIAIVDTWQWTPFMMLLLLAGLLAQPHEVGEAAQLDGSPWQVFRHVTFPLLLPWSVSAILLRAIEAIKVADLVAVVTRGGPGISTESVTLYAYETGVQNLDLGYASAISFTLLLVATLLTLGFLFLVRPSIARVT